MDCYGNSDSSDEGGQRRRRRRGSSSDSDIDEDEAARRFNRKHNHGYDSDEIGFGESWLDKIRRKQKSGATEGHTLKEMLDS